MSESVKHLARGFCIYNGNAAPERSRRGKKKVKVSSEEIHPDKRKTFTCDNGKEFCGHQELSQKLGADFYFATPYHSWERGLNEHTKGLLRQFFPKGTNFKILKPEEVERAVNLINNRPR